MLIRCGQEGLPLCVSDYRSGRVPIDLLDVRNAPIVRYDLDTRILCVDREFMTRELLTTLRRSKPCKESSSAAFLIADHMGTIVIGEADRVEGGPIDVKARTFFPRLQCDFRRDIAPSVAQYYRNADIRNKFALASESLVLELGGVEYAVDSHGFATVYSPGGFMPAVSETLALMQTEADVVEIDKGVLHVNLVFVGKQPTTVYLPDSCVSCWIGKDSVFKLSMGEKLARLWPYQSAVWGKAYEVHEGFTSTPDGLVTVRGR